MHEPAHTSSAPQKIRLGDRLIEAGLITDEQLQQALAEQEQTGRRLGQALIELKIIDEEELLFFLSKQLGTEYVDLKKFTLEPDTVKIITEIQARRLRVIALEKGNIPVIGMADPTDIIAFDELGQILKGPFRAALVKESVLLKAIDKIYRQTDKIRNLAAEVDQHLENSTNFLDQGDDNIDNSDAPLIQLLNTMITDAVTVTASDIHIEPEEDKTRIRFRIDGVLQEQAPASRRLAGALISRLKLMANLDISEKRLPQDGRFRFTARSQLIDIRLSTMPMQHGESAVMRLLNQTAGIPDLDTLGLGNDTLERFRKVIHAPHGIVLVTGPTGSGKTTTLYSALNEINDPGKKIITIEDPIEYQMQGITQVQVNPKINLDFARVLRSLLRQDPDIALIGEMRDTETMEMALRTAMTGHLVLSTLHTNDAASAVARLTEMGAAPFMVSSSLRGILAQRLIRKLCDNCATPVSPTPAEQALIATTFGEDNTLPLKLKHAQGCRHCNDTGYFGRTCVGEFIEIDDTLIEILQTGEPQDFVHLATTQPGFQSIGKTALKLALNGVTSFEEVTRICSGNS